ncbi:MAG: hypothetical protein CM1200mP2_32950 [Planctomycetaceae bacterium]|nr:MAG: hypothetical protein CM1200mP2_32950 [Planctomycetaceae bacterium]
MTTVKLELSIEAVLADQNDPLPGSAASRVSGVVGVLSRERCRVFQVIVHAGARRDVPSWMCLDGPEEPHWPWKLTVEDYVSMIAQLRTILLAGFTASLAVSNATGKSR